MSIKPEDGQHQGCPEGCNSIKAAKLVLRRNIKLMKMGGIRPLKRGSIKSVQKGSIKFVKRDSINPDKGGNTETATSGSF